MSEHEEQARRMSHHARLRADIQSTRALALWKDYTVDFVKDASPISEEQHDFLFDRGFTPEKWDLYGFDQNDPDEYLSDVQRSLTRWLNGPYDMVFNNKILFTQVFSGLARVPETVAVWRSKRMIPYGPLWEQVRQGQAGNGLRLVAKPVGGGGGNNIYFLTCGPDEIKVESNIEGDRVQRFSPVHIDSLFAGARVPFIINRYLPQGSFSASLYPRTVNTIRALVIRDPETLQPHLVRAVQRIGTSESYPIDNFTFGGLSCPIDLESGELGEGVSGGGRLAGIFQREHPDTGMPLVGAKIPNWHDIKEGLLELFVQLPYLNYCGFDVVSQDDGFGIIEGNSYSQVRLFQMHAPLLTDPIYRRFLRHYGILQDLRDTL